MAAVDYFNHDPVVHQLDLQARQVRARSTRLAGSVRDCAIDLNLSKSASPSDLCLDLASAVVLFSTSRSLNLTESGG